MSCLFEHYHFVINMFLLLFCLYFIQNIAISLNPCSLLPNECQLKLDRNDPKQFKSEIKSLICVLLNDIIFNFRLTKNITITDLNQQTNECEIRDQDLTSFTFLATPFSNIVLLEKTMNFSNFLNFLTNLNDYAAFNTSFTITFQSITGFQLTTFNTDIVNENTIEILIHIFKSKFHLYANATSRIESCDENMMISNNNNNHHLSIFKANSFIEELSLIRCQFDIKICPLVFRGVNISTFEIYRMVKSFLKTNALRFWRKNDDYVEANIANVNLNSVENIDLDSSLLDEYVFKNVQRLRICGQIDTIQVDVLRPLIRIRHIVFEMRGMRDVLHRNGIQWIRYINEAVNVSLDNYMGAQNKLGTLDFRSILK